MKRVLVVIIVLELLVGAGFALRQWLKERPPLPATVLGDPTAARDLAEMTAHCRSGGDWARLGEAYLAYGYLGEAESCYKRAAGLEPENASHAFHHAFVIERMGRIDDANRRYHVAIEKGVDNPEDCWYFIGRNHLRLGAAEKARDAFENAGELPAARYELARLLAFDKQREQASVILQELREEYPDAIGPAVMLYQLSLLAGESTRTLADEARYAHEPLATPFDEQHARITAAYERLGAARRWRRANEQFSAGDIEAAVRTLASVDEDEWSPIAADLESQIDIAQGLTERAVYKRKEIIDWEGPTMLSLGRLGDAYQLLGREEDAKEAWRRALALGAGPQIKDVHERLSRLYERAGEIELAREHAALMHLHEGIRLFWSNAWPDSQGEWRNAIDLNPRLADAWYYHGLTLLRRDQPEEGRKALEEALRLNPDHGRAADALRG
jgi:tetratricopeptide (TPR) repeat protein